MYEEEPTYNESLTTCSKCETKYFASESEADDYERFCSLECQNNSDCCDAKIEFGICVKCQEHV